MKVAHSKSHTALEEMGKEGGRRGRVAPHMAERPVSHRKMVSPFAQGLPSSRPRNANSQTILPAVSHTSTVEIQSIFFPPTPSGYDARIRWDTVVLGAQQAVTAARELRDTYLKLVPLLPGNGPLAVASAAQAN